MPGAVARPCLECGRVTTYGSRCPTHQAAYERQRGRRRKRRRSYGAEWSRLSKRTIAAQPWCSICADTRDLTADHIVPRAKGGDDSPANVQVLCRSCNGRKAGRLPGGRWR